MQRLGLRVQADIDADAFQHRDHCIADRLVVDVAVVRAVEGDREAVTVTGLRKQLPGLFGIVLVGRVEILDEAVDARRDHQPRRGGSAAHDHALNGLQIDRVSEGRTHALILEGVLAGARHVEQLVTPLIETEKDRPQFGTFQDIDVGFVLQTRHVLQRHRVHHVDLAREQRGNARRVVGDRRQDGAVDVGHQITGVPVVFEGLEDQAVVLYPLDHPEGSGAVGIEVREVGLPGAAHHLEGVVLLNPLLIHDVEVGHVEQQDRVGTVGNDLYRVVVDLTDLFDRGDRKGHVRRFLRLALEGIDHIVGREGVSVVEGDAFAQGETPSHLVHVFPTHRQIRLQREVRLAVNQHAIDVALHGVGRTLVIRMGVQTQNVAGGGVAEHLILRLRVLRRRQCEGRNGSHSSDQSQTVSHSCLPVTQSLYGRTATATGCFRDPCFLLLRQHSTIPITIDRARGRQAKR